MKSYLIDLVLITFKLNKQLLYLAAGGERKIHERDARGSRYFRFPGLKLQILLYAVGVIGQEAFPGLGAGLGVNAFLVVVAHGYGQRIGGIE